MVSLPVFDIWRELAFHWFQTLWLPTWPPPQPPPQPPWHHDFHPDHHLDGQVRAGVDCPRRVRLARLSFHARVQGPSNLRAVSVIFLFRKWSFNCAFAFPLALCMFFPFAMSMLHVFIFYSSRSRFLWPLLSAYSGKNVLCNSKIKTFYLFPPKKLLIPCGAVYQFQS